MSEKVDDKRESVQLHFEVTPMQRLFLKGAAKAVGETLRSWVMITLLQSAAEILGITFLKFSRENSPKRKPGQVQVSTQSALKELGLEDTQQGEPNERSSIWG